MNEPNGQNDVESRGSITLNMNRNGKYQTSLNYTVGGQQNKETAENTRAGRRIRLYLDT